MGTTEGVSVALSELETIAYRIQGRRPDKSGLAPGYLMPRLRRFFSVTACSGCTSKLNRDEQWENVQ